MTYSKKPGVYFTESVGTADTVTTSIPLFIVQTTSTLSIDGEYTLYTSIDTFKTVVADKGLTNTVKYIEQALDEIGVAIPFYVYSIKTDTAAAFTKVITDCDNIPEINKVYYIEESKSAAANTFVNKCGALQLGCVSSAAKGIHKVAFAVPYGTITDTYTNTEGDALGAVVTALQTEGSTVAGDRLAIINPDNYAGAVIGKSYTTPYNEDIGFGALNTPVSTLTYNFTDSQELTLMNAGILFITSELRQGTKINRVCLGVSTAFSGNAADGELIVRTIADEVLNNVKNACEPFIKSKSNEQQIAFLQADIDTIIEEFAENGDIDGTSSVLTVSQASNYSFNVTGTLKPSRAVIAIEVNTTIN